ncbi:GerAB/ArcD/ProY family transporter [Fervidibacillus halotolerans]|uniref:Spore germination protein n=1 Tax=Fervidibacillus halotolerans TaxID=2980027 RepID=A0A9E8LZN3_9BACI|nr:GerAB/ArcD/ProY family transporter [Fervidibacillus halotolerans]WAA11936.1 spore germination protein [Fervidibacillus halotolerans]
MNKPIPEQKKVAPFMLFYIVASIQIGVGILSFQRDLVKVTGYDGWISIIINGIGTIILIWMIVQMTTTIEGDLLDIVSFSLGKWISKLIGLFYMLYFSLFSITVLRNYVEMIQVWMFPKLPIFWFSLVILLLVLYVVYGGFRTVAGISFFSFFLPMYIFPLFLFTVPHADFTNLLPIFDHSVKELFFGSYQMSLSILGFESILFVYPFLKEPKKAIKWAYLAIIFTISIYLYLALLSFSYFSEAQLVKNHWPTLTMWKIIRLPFVERFEYIGIATWCLIVLPNICISLWIASRLAKQIFFIRQKQALLFISGIVLIVTSMIMKRSQVLFVSQLLGKIGFFANYCFIPILYFITMFAKKVKKQ